jgi:hypothetical protein
MPRGDGLTLPADTSITNLAAALAPQRCCKVKPWPVVCTPWLTRICWDGAGALGQTEAPTSVPTTTAAAPTPIQPTSPTSPTTVGRYVVRLTTTFHALELSTLEDDTQQGAFTAAYVSITATAAVAPPEAVVVNSILAGSVKVKATVTLPSQVRRWSYRWVRIRELSRDHH